MKQAFWKTDRFVGIAITALFLLLWLARNPVLEGFERNAYDLGVRASNKTPGDQVAIVAIDDKSIQHIGRWPWPRNIHAQAIEKLAAAGTKTIALSIFYSEQQRDPGLEWIKRVRAHVADAGLTEITAAGLLRTLDEAQSALDTDAVLAHSLATAANVVLAMQFVPGVPVGNPDQALPEFVSHNAVPKKNLTDAGGHATSRGFLPIETLSASPPIEDFGVSAARIGHLNTLPDVDGGVRFEPLILRYFDAYYPSLALMVAAHFHNLRASDIKVKLGESVELGPNLRIKTDTSSLMNTHFYGLRDGNRQPFPVYSFNDVLQDQVSNDTFQGKIALIGPTAFGVGSSFHTPVGTVAGPVEILAHTVASILNQNFFVRPGWAHLVEFMAILAVGAYLVWLLPQLRAATAGIVSVLFGIALLATEIGLLATQNLWFKLMTALTLLILGHIFLTTKRFLVTEASKLRLDADSAMSNKQLAQQFQQQGQLDLAFEHYRKCPADEALLELIYSLGADYEAKRKFSRAAAAYQYIVENDPSFRDVEEKVTRAKHLEETVLLGGSSPKAGGTMLLDGGIAKPMLGRYEVEKQLGEGAMGIVYLGRDPKINRVVAIKTMALAEEFEADEVDEVKARFFREAETAGRLQHPNIVTIYDAGEEHDLAYIAMEYLEGHDLARYVKRDNLLSLATVMGIVYRAANALDYAHKQNVVHRDIKPANIMYEPKKKQVKLTDFGIARITDSSRTKTGMVLGTPSYMSPEQLSGRKVDGRSDLFSLGVMLYQLTTGKLPFAGESLATLMYKIANEPHAELAQLRPELAKQRPCLGKIIDRALQKDVDQRYQTGAEMARDIQACAKSSSK